MSRSNHMEPDKIILARWMDQALEQSLTKKTSSLGLQLQEYGLWNPKAMDNRPSEVFIAKNLNNAGSEKEYTIDNDVKKILNREKNLLLQNFSI